MIAPQEAIRQKLHDYIDKANQRKLEAIYIILEEEIEHGQGYNEETIARFYKIRENHLNGNSKYYTVEETLESIRRKKIA